VVNPARAEDANFRCRSPLPDAIAPSPCHRCIPDAIAAFPTPAPTPTRPTPFMPTPPHANTVRNLAYPTPLPPDFRWHDRLIYDAAVRKDANIYPCYDHTGETNGFSGTILDLMKTSPVDVSPFLINKTRTPHKWGRIAQNPIVSHVHPA
jgi:hypothetical protein